MVLKVDDIINNKVSIFTSRSCGREFLKNTVLIGCIRAIMEGKEEFEVKILGGVK